MLGSAKRNNNKSNQNKQNSAQNNNNEIKLESTMNMPANDKKN